MMRILFSKFIGSNNNGVKSISRFFPAPVSGISALCFLLFALLGACVIKQMELNLDQMLQRTAAAKRVTDVAGLLSSAMNIRLNLTNSLNAFVITRSDFTHEQFERFATIMKSDLHGITSLQLAPNGIVTYITELVRNKNAIGHNLLTDPLRREIALKSIREHSFIIAGPIDLIQGGQAVIARRPIYLSTPASTKDEFWGFATVLIDIDTLLDDGMVESLRQDFDIAIRGKDGLGAKGDVFVGEPSVFNEPLALATIAFPNASWQIAVAEKTNQQRSGFFYSAWYWFVATFIAMTGSLMVYSIVDRPRHLKHKIDKATEILKIEISQRELAEQKVRYMALHDVLTNLPNRRLFDELGGQALSLGKRNNLSLAVLFIDIDGFKAVNDNFGHAGGDLLLKKIAQLLQQQVRGPDIVARFGGDEFVILLSENCQLSDAKKVAAKIISAISSPFDIAGSQAQVGASIGIAIYPAHGNTIEQLVIKADDAMYQAKNNGKNCFKIA